MENIIRLLKAEEIECRVATINENGLSLLMYKDARVDQRILDESFGLFGWKRSHQCIDGKLYCTVEILNKETGEWISKQDVGTTSYSEKEKGRHRILLRELALTGELGVNYIQCRLFGFRQVKLLFKRRWISIIVRKTL